MSSAATQFLQAIVPNQDLLCIAHSREIPARGRGTKPWTQRFFTAKQVANGVLVDHLSELNQHHDTNVYFSVATFKQRKREKVNVTKLKCVLLDIDLKGDRPHYKTKPDAVSGLVKLWKEIPCLPKPWIVDSGNGIHAYFVFDAVVDMKDWYVVANTFAKVAENVDPRLLADPKPTKDAARVMRVPNSWNAKQQKRGHVKVLGKGETVKFADLKSGLASEAAARGVWVKQVVPDNTPLVDSTSTPTHAVGTASALSGGFNRDQSTFTGLNPVPIAKGCKQMNRMMKLKGNVSEPEWLLMMRVLNTCDKSEQLIHTFSKGHPSYTKSGTDQKIRHMRNTFGSPSAGCDEFREMNDQHCKGCKFRDKVWTPSQLGEFAQKKELRAEQTVVADKKLMEGEKTEQGYLPLAPYYNQTRVAESHQPVTTIPVWQGKDEGERHLPVIGGHINIVGSSQRIETTSRGQETVTDMMIHLNVDVWNRSGKLAVPSKIMTMTQLDRSHEQLREMGVTFNVDGPQEAKALRKFFNDVVRVASHRPVPYYHTKGWTPDGLTLGAVKLCPNQKPLEGYTWGEHKRRSDRSMEKFCTGRPVGMEGKWKQGMSVFNGDNPHAHIVLLSGIANILLPLNPGMQGGIVIALTGDSGKGKTTLMNFMNSFVGHPTEGIVQGTSTDKVMLDMLKQSSVFMLPVDDMTSMSPQNLSALASTVTSGRPRQRLEQQSGGDWDVSEADTINASLMLTSNFSAAGAFMAGNKSDNRMQLEAVMTRQIEIPAHDTYIAGVSDQRWDFAKTLVENNYGHALRPFGQYLVDNRSLVKQMLADRKTAFGKALTQRLKGSISGQYRFWIRYLAGIRVAADILSSLGLINWNVSNITQTGIDLAVAQQEHTQEVQSSDMGALWDILTNDDNGRVNINLSEFMADDATYPRWDNVHANRSRGQKRSWTKKANNSMFQQITHRVVNSAEWRVLATEVYKDDKLVRMERSVYISINKLRAVIRSADTLAATAWEELRKGLEQAGALVIGTLPNNANRSGNSRHRISQTENNKGHSERSIEIIFPPIYF